MLRVTLEGFPPMVVVTESTATTDVQRRRWCTNEKLLVDYGALIRIWLVTNFA